MIVTSKQMKQIEQNANGLGVPYLTMMENAGSQAAEYIRRTLKQLEGLKVAVFCGKGNNGGDGLVVARRLFQMGCDVNVILCDGVPSTNDAQTMYNQAVELGIPMLHMDAGEEILALMQEVDVVVDAIYGSGFHGEMDELHQALCTLMNSAIAAVFSLDIPSGIGCDSGEISPNAVMADFTIVFDSLKPAHLLSKIIPNMGRIIRASIGIPHSAHDGIEELVSQIDESIVEKIPQKPIDAHKTSTGRLQNFAGSFGMAGAAILSGMGALRSGAGYLVTVCPRDVYPIIATNLIQSTFKFLDGSYDVRPLLGGASAVAVGCGMGQGENQRTLLKNILSTAKCPVIIDADGLNNLSRDLDLLKERTCPVIITPHAGEMASLCKCKAPDILRRPIGYALDFAREHNVIVLLKGANTIIATPEGQIAVNSTGNPGLAKAGSGDVLTGMIASFVSQGMEPLDAVKCGVYLHGLAADRCAERLGQTYMQPDDILTDLGVILQ